MTLTGKTRGLLLGLALLTQGGDLAFACFEPKDPNPDPKPTN